MTTAARPGVLGNPEVRDEAPRQTSLQGHFRAPHLIDQSAIYQGQAFPHDLEVVAVGIPAAALRREGHAAYAGLDQAPGG